MGIRPSKEERMKRVLSVAVLSLAALALVLPAVPAGASGQSVQVSRIADRLVLKDHGFPAAFTFDPTDGTLYYANRYTGQIRHQLKDGTTQLVYLVTNLLTDGEQGLLGLAFDPDWPTSPYLYAYASRDDGGLVNEILKIHISGGVGDSMSVIWQAPTDDGNNHDGGHIVFGPDGKLYAQVGDGQDPENAQDLTTDTGKILRMNSDGSAPGDNKLGGRIFAMGMRNGFGYTFDPDSGRLWETENGPECNDEINQFQNGMNGGWGPSENCDGKSPDDTNNSGPLPRRFPQRWFTPTIAPTGITFCPDTCGLPGHHGHAFFGSFNDHKIREFALDEDRRKILPGWPKVVLTMPVGILSMERNPYNSHLYFSTQDGIYLLVAG
jgi:glucose/arabinose dehydrogenase